MKKSFFILSLMVSIVLNAEVNAGNVSSANMPTNGTPAYTNCYGESHCLHFYNDSYEASYGKRFSIYFTVSGPDNDAMMTIYGTMDDGDSTSVADYAMSGYYLGYTFTSMNFVGNVDIGMRSFKGMTSLKSVVLPDSFFDGGTLKNTINSQAFEESGLNTIYCPHDKVCPTTYFTGLSTTPTVVSYKEDEIGTGVYIVGNEEPYSYYLSMSHIPADPCDDMKSCQIASLQAQGDKCITQIECQNLIDMVSSNDYNCNSITTCRALATTNGLDLANMSFSGTGGADSGTGSGKRIYTVEEARAAVEAAGTDTVNFRIRYK